MIVLDTNVLSEIIRPRPNESVQRWWETQPSSRLFATSVARAELLSGVGLMPTGKRKTMILFAIVGVLDDVLDQRILDFDRDAADAYAEILPVRRRCGKPISPLDAMTAAITKSRGAMLATRNTKDFVDCGIELINPWEISPSPSGG